MFLDSRLRFGQDLHNGIGKSERILPQVAKAFETWRIRVLQGIANQSSTKAINGLRVPAIMVVCITTAAYRIIGIICWWRVPRVPMRRDGHSILILWA